MRFPGWHKPRPEDVTATLPSTPTAEEVERFAELPLHGFGISSGTTVVDLGYGLYYGQIPWAWPEREHHSGERR